MLATLAVIVAFVAGRETAPAVQAKTIVSVQREVVTVPGADTAVHCPSLDDEPREDIAEEPDDEPASVDIADTPAMRQFEAAAKLRTTVELDPNGRGAIFGTARDAKTGELLAGVTVTAFARDAAQTAITDEDGYYQITDLPPDVYTVTFYYLDSTLEHAGVAVAARKSTPVYTKLYTSPEPGITIDQEYVRNIPVPSRTFEGVLGEAAGEGISFSSGSQLENEYIVVE